MEKIQVRTESGKRARDVFEEWHAKLTHNIINNMNLAFVYKIAG